MQEPRPRDLEFPHVPLRGLTVPLLEWASMNWIDTTLGLTRDQWVVVGLMGSSLEWFGRWSGSNGQS